MNTAVNFQHSNQFSYVCEHCKQFNTAVNTTSNFSHVCEHGQKHSTFITPSIIATVDVVTKICASVRNFRCARFFTVESAQLCLTFVSQGEKKYEETKKITQRRWRKRRRGNCSKFWFCLAKKFSLES